jgi:hypothetical protein
LNTMVAAVHNEARGSVVSDVNAALAQYESDTGLELPTAVNIVTARA